MIVKIKIKNKIHLRTQLEYNILYCSLYNREIHKLRNIWLTYFNTEIVKTKTQYDF